jgi:hypothetical protein
MQIGFSNVIPIPEVDFRFHLKSLGISLSRSLRALGLFKLAESAGAFSLKIGPIPTHKHG